MFGVKSRRRLNTQPLYSKLPPGTIRLVRLLPATSSGLECELFESTLQIARNHYNALSYTWGETNPGERAIITVNETVVGIKANLYNALRRVRQRTQPVVLWVDSLCIDQSDEADRTQQVGMMRDIYASSSEVIIWLGIRGRGDDLGESVDPGGSNSEDVGRRIRFTGDERDVDKLDSYLSQLAARKQKLSPDAIDIYGAFCVISMLSQGVLASKIWYLRHLDHSPPIIRGLNAIMQKSWWRRVWVVQETVVAQRATVCYSDMSIPWEAFSRAAECYENGRVSENLGSISYLTYGGPLGHFCRMVTEIDSTRRNWTNPYQPLALLPALRKFRDRDASDRKDKVFALVGLVKAWGLQAPLLPDYGLETWRIFWETTVRLIETSKSLAILAGTLGNHIDMGNPPSWVTDWSHPPEPHEHYRLNNATLYDASGSVRERVRLHDGMLLEVHGYYVDRVVFLGKDSQEIGAARSEAQSSILQSTLTDGSEAQGSLMQRTAAEWGSSFNWMDNDEYVNSGDLGDAFWRTICADSLYFAGETGGPVEETRGEFRRAGSEGLRAYRSWRRRVDPSNNRRTSIIGGTLQESIGADDDHQQGKNDFQLAVDCASSGRKFFRTQRGYIGTGPRSMKLGDGVFILVGSRVPIIMRPSSDMRRCRNTTVRQLIAADTDEIDLKTESGIQNPKRAEFMICDEAHPVCFKVVGDAYVHGIMDGEMVWEDERRERRRATESFYLT